MGHREALLKGAKRCIIEKGYARTTARDVVEASSTNLASIGYHFGSMENLMSEALIALHNEWGDQIEAVMAAKKDAPPALHFRAGWEEMLRQNREDRNVAVAGIEVMAQALRSPAVTRALADAYAKGRHGLFELFAGDASAYSKEDRVAVGSAILALIAGLMIQEVLEPGSSPDADSLMRALRILGKAAGEP